MCERLLTHRNETTMASKLGSVGGPGTKARRGGPSVGELPVCGPGGARCIGGVSSSRALAWNRRTCRPDRDGRGFWPVGAHNSVVCADQGFRAPSGDQESVRDSVHEDSASALWVPRRCNQEPRNNRLTNPGNPCKCLHFVHAGEAGRQPGITHTAAAATTLVVVRTAAEPQRVSVEPMDR